MTSPWASRHVIRKEDHGDGEWLMKCSCGDAWVLPKTASGMQLQEFKRMHSRPLPESRQSRFKRGKQT
jgi:hypothetical protein